MSFDHYLFYSTFLEFSFFIGTQPSIAFKREINIVFSISGPVTTYIQNLLPS